MLTKSLTEPGFDSKPERVRLNQHNLKHDKYWHSEVQLLKLIYSELDKNIK